MIKGNSVLAVVPARGGSKGIKLKNLQKVNDKSLVQMVAEIVSQLEYIDRAIVSTDHQEIAEVAIKHGLDVPFLRPYELSRDIVSDVDVLTHALTTIEKIDKKKYNIIVMLQPTSPLRKSEHVTKTVMKLVKGEYDSVLTVSETDSKVHPLKQLIFKENKIDYYHRDGQNIIARQQLKPVFQRNGVAYAITRECLLKQKSVIGQNASAIVINEIMVNIDTKLDLKIAQYLLQENI